MTKVPFNLELFKQHGSNIEILEYENGMKPLDIWIPDVLLKDKTIELPIRTINQYKSVLIHRLNGTNSTDARGYTLKINIPDEIVEFYHNVYPDGLSGVEYNSVEDANKFANLLKKRIAIIKIIINKTTGEVKSEIMPV